MAYGSTQSRMRGIKREPIIISGVSSSLFRDGYPNRALIPSVNENINKHIDATFIFDSNQFRGYREIPVDVKSTASLTILNVQGKDSLKNSIAIYFVFEYSPDSSEYVFVKRTKLMEVMNSYPPNILTGKDKKSKYFWMNTYLDSHSDKFNSEELFTIKK